VQKQRLSDAAYHILDLNTLTNGDSRESGIFDNHSTWPSLWITESYAKSNKLVSLNSNQELSRVLKHSLDLGQRSEVLQFRAFCLDQMPQHVAGDHDVAVSYLLLGVPLLPPQWFFLA